MTTTLPWWAMMYGDAWRKKSTNASGPRPFTFMRSSRVRLSSQDTMAVCARGGGERVRGGGTGEDSESRANAGGRGRWRAVGRGRTAGRPPNAETETFARDARRSARDARRPARDARGRSSTRGAVPTAARTRALAGAAMPDIHPRALVADDRGTREGLAGRATCVARACAEDARRVVSRAEPPAADDDVDECGAW